MGGLQITKMRWTPERDAELRQWLNIEGKTAAFVAETYRKTFGIDCTRAMVIGRAKRVGLSRWQLRGGAGGSRPLNAVPTPRKIRNNPIKARTAPKPSRISGLNKRTGRLPLTHNAIVDHRDLVAFEGNPKRLSLDDLTNTSCRWICTEPGDDGRACYCGHEIVKSNWCAYHAGIVYQVA